MPDIKLFTSSGDPLPLDGKAFLINSINHYRSPEPKVLQYRF